MDSSNFFTAEERQQLLKECFEVIEWLHDFERRQSKYRLEPGFIELLQKEHTQLEYLKELRKQYSSKVPIIPLCRCPYCHTVNFLSLDYYGLDGLWWRYDESWRNWEQQQVCSHFWTLSGAMHLAEPIIPAPFEALPGPEVPFVIPHALENYPIQAVITQIQVGAHTAYPIAYFSASKPMQVEKSFPEWSYAGAVWVQEDNRLEADLTPYYELNTTADFDIARWIEQGKAWWIEPDDSSFTLQNSLKSCPYLSLSGRREILYVYRGKTRTQNQHYS
jgi:hypothetical protein